MEKILRLMEKKLGTKRSHSKGEKIRSETQGN
jgi:hypothetical protein